MKNYLITVAGIVVLIFASTGLQTSASTDIPSTDIRSDEKRQMRSRSHAISFKTDGQSINAVTSDNQSQSSTVEISSPTTADIFLERVRANSRMQAADAAYNLSILAANRKDLTRARTLIVEPIRLNQFNPNDLTLAADIAFQTQKYDSAAKYQMMILEIARYSLGRLIVTQRQFDEARMQFEQVLLLLKQNYAQDHPYIQQAIINITELNAKRERYAEKDRIYDELLWDFSSRFPKHKGVTADITAPLPEQRIVYF